MFLFNKGRCKNAFEMIYIYDIYIAYNYDDLLPRLGFTLIWKLPGMHTIYGHVTKFIPSCATATVFQTVSHTQPYWETYHPDSPKMCSICQSLYIFERPPLKGGGGDLSYFEAFIFSVFTVQWNVSCLSDRLYYRPQTGYQRNTPVCKQATSGQ